MGHLPPSLTHLNISGRYNKNKMDHLPSSITHLTVGPEFDFPIYDLPPNLIELHLDRNFNHPIDHLPNPFVF